MKSKHFRVALPIVAVLALATVGATQIKQVIKLVGVSAAVKQFGPDMNRALNKLVKHTDTNDSFTKVVPIITLGNDRNAIGAVQVKGAKINVEKVQAVAAPQVNLFGREIQIRGLIPIAETSVKSIDDIKAVPGVGVSGIVDLKL